MRIPTPLALSAAALLAVCVTRGISAQGADARAGITQQGPAGEPFGPLALVDDYGRPIFETEIESRIRKGGAKWYFQPIGFIVGSVTLFTLTPKPPNNADCSIYEPCTDRENFYRASSALAGGLIGLLLINAAGPEVSRTEAISLILAERRTRGAPRR